MKAKAQKLLLAINFAIVVIICLALIAQPQIPFLERVLFGFGAIFFGMGIRRFVKILIPINDIGKQ